MRTLGPAHVPEASRYGSFLRAIPASRRLGDHAHAAARVLNAVFNRVFTQATNWGVHARPDLSRGACPGCGVGLHWDGC